MTAIAIEPFDGFFEAHDDHNKPARFPCRAIAVTGSGFQRGFIVLTTSDDGDCVGAIEVDQVFTSASKPAPNA